MTDGGTLWPKRHRTGCRGREGRPGAGVRLTSLLRWTRRTPRGAGRAAVLDGAARRLVAAPGAPRCTPQRIPASVHLWSRTPEGSLKNPRSPCNRPLVAICRGKPSRHHRPAPYPVAASTQRIRLGAWTRFVGNEREWPQKRSRVLNMTSVKKQVISSGRRLWAAGAEKPGPEGPPAGKRRSRGSAARFLGFTRPETGSARNDGVLHPNSVMPAWGRTGAGTAPFRQRGPSAS
jgi:hypothetical protein